MHLLVKGNTVTVDDIPSGKIMTVKLGADTLYNDAFQPDTILQTLHIILLIISCSDKRLKEKFPINALKCDIFKFYSVEYNKNFSGFLDLKGIHYGFYGTRIKECLSNICTNEQQWILYCKFEYIYSYI